MKALRPTLWRTCRVIASETRLNLLWSLFLDGELCVKDLAEKNQMDPAHASIQLRALNARGLISSRRQKMMVIYRAEANPAVDSAEEILKGLRLCHRRNDTFDSIMYQATAFTHQRRIEIMRYLKKESLEIDQLSAVTGISHPALMRHLEKLIRRGFVRQKGDVFKAPRTKNRFGQLLSTLVG